MVENNFGKKLISSFREKKLLLFCLAYMLLPVSLLAPFAHNLSKSDSLLSVGVNIGIFFIAFLTLQFLRIKTIKTCCSVLLIITLIPGAIFLGYLLFAQVFLLSDSIISIFETNPEESKEFIAYYMNPFITLGILAYASVPVVMIYRMKGDGVFSIQKNKLIFTLCVILLLATPFTSISKSVYYINFYETYIQYKKRHYDEEKEIARRLTKPFKVESLLPKNESQTIIVVLGESLARHHMSLYGYGRKTNIYLQRSDSLDVYDDVTSPQVHTIPVVRRVMSFVEKNHPEYFYERPSFFELFNRAGYETYFITNQPFGGRYETSYDLLLSQAKNKFNPSMQKKPDEVTLPYLNEILNKKEKTNRLILIHLMGSHMAYEFRYPKEFDLFHNDKDHFIRSKKKYMTPEAIKSIDAYDNSVRYNDELIHRIIESAKKAGGNAAVVYFSDHGEEVYENRNFAGHAYEKVSTYMCEIPFIVWHSRSFGNYRKDIVYSPKRAFSTADFLYSISDLAGLRYKNFDPKRSLFNVAFKPRERYIGDYTYEKVKEMTKSKDEN